MIRIAFCETNCLFILLERAEKKIRFSMANGMFKTKIDIDRHSPRLMPNKCKNLNPPYFSLPTTFNHCAVLIYSTCKKALFYVVRLTCYTFIRMDFCSILVHVLFNSEHSPRFVQILSAWLRWTECNIFLHSYIVTSSSAFFKIRAWEVLHILHRVMYIS